MKTDYKKSILIAGGSGYLGRNLANYLYSKNYGVTILSRRTVPLKGIKSVLWDPYYDKLDTAKLEAPDIVINLTGNSIADKLWSKKRKKEIIKSRVEPLEFLLKCFKDMDFRPEKLISSSAVGYYGNRGEEELSEASAPGSGFLPQVCVEWETVANNFRALNCKVVIGRIGVVMSQYSGFVFQVKRSQMFGLNIIPGNGKQIVPWISLRDFMRSVEFLINKPGSTGPYNLCSPEFLTLEKIQENIAGRVMRKVHIPPKILQFTIKDFSEIFLNTMKVYPKKLLLAGFNFMDNNLENCL